jgi:hypothetical protein
MEPYRMRSVHICMPIRYDLASILFMNLPSFLWAYFIGTTIRGNRLVPGICLLNFHTSGFRADMPPACFSVEAY